MAHTYTRIIHHVVFSTKGRRPLIHSALRERLHAYLAGIIKNSGGHALRVGGTDNHVHLLIELGPPGSVSDMVRSVKANSSKWIHETFSDASAFQWQSGYAAFSVSPSGVGEVSSHIENQEEHHRRRSFDEEFLALLTRCGVPYDERYVFG